MTSDPQEIEKFSQLSATWWDLQGPLKTLHHINPCRIEYIQRYASLAQRKVLDVGCGGGVLSEALWQQNAIVTAIDLDPQGIAAAKAHQQQSGSEVSYQIADVAELAKTSQERYDIITCMELLEHVPNPSLVIESCAKLLKPEGYLFLSTLNRTIKAYGLAVLAAEYLLRLLPKGTHDYQKFITPAELVATCRQAHLECENLQGMHYNPLTAKACFGKDLGVNYLACFKLFSS